MNDLKKILISILVIFNFSLFFVISAGASTYFPYGDKYHNMPPEELYAGKDYIILDNLNEPSSVGILIVFTADTYMTISASHQVACNHDHTFIGNYEFFGKEFPNHYLSLSKVERYHYDGNKWEYFSGLNSVSFSTQNVVIKSNVGYLKTLVYPKKPPDFRYLGGFFPHPPLVVGVALTPILGEMVGLIPILVAVIITATGLRICGRVLKTSLMVC